MNLQAALRNKTENKELLYFFNPNGTGVFLGQSEPGGG